jgi:hypothetical protein
LVENVTEFKQLNRSVKFNLLGSSSSLHVPVNKVKMMFEVYKPKFLITQYIKSLQKL